VYSNGFFSGVREVVEVIPIYTQSWNNGCSCGVVAISAVQFVKEAAYA